MAEWDVKMGVLTIQEQTYTTFYGHPLLLAEYMKNLHAINLNIVNQ